MSKVKTERERKEFLSSIGLNPDAPALEPLPARPEGGGHEAPKVDNIKLAPEGMDPRTMPVKDIVLDRRLVDQFPSLAPQDRSVAANYVFSLYKSNGRNKDRNSLLWSEIGKWLVRVHREREHGISMDKEPVKDKVKRGKKERDLLAVMRELGVESVDDLKAMLGEKGGEE